MKGLTNLPMRPIR